MEDQERILQPGQFERYVAVMAMEQRDKLLVVVPYLCQYNNYSVVVVLVEHPPGGLLRSQCSLTIGDETGTVEGGGTDEAIRFRFAVTPRIPDEQAAHIPITVHIDPGTEPRLRGFESVAPITPTTIRFHNG